MKDCQACINCTIPVGGPKVPLNFRHFCPARKTYLVTWKDEKYNASVTGIKDAETCEYFKLLDGWKPKEPQN